MKNEYKVIIDWIDKNLKIGVKENITAEKLINVLKEIITSSNYLIDNYIQYFHSDEELQEILDNGIDNKLYFNSDTKVLIIGNLDGDGYNSFDLKELEDNLKKPKVAALENSHPYVVVVNDEGESAKCNATEFGKVDKVMGIEPDANKNVDISGVAMKWTNASHQWSNLPDKSADATYNKVMVLDNNGKAGTKDAGDFGKVKTVNGQEPDENGNIPLDCIPLTGTEEGKPITGTLGMKGSFGHVFIRNEGDSAATLYSHYSTDPTIGSSHLSFMYNSMLFVNTHTKNGVEKESSFTVSPTGFEYTNSEDRRLKSTFIANSRKFETSYSNALNRRFFEIGEDGFIHKQTHNNIFGTLESEIRNDKKGYKVLSKYTDQYESVRDFSQIHTDTEFNTQVKSISPLGYIESTILEQTITDFRIWTENKTSSTVTKIPYTPTEEASISTKGYVDAMQTKPTNWTNANQRFSGLVDKSSDATYDKVMVLDDNGNAGMKNLDSDTLIDILTNSTPEQINQIKTLLGI